MESLYQNGLLFSGKMAMEVCFYYHKTYEQHNPGWGHPERPERLHAILTALEKRDITGELQWIEPSPVKREYLALVHSEDYIDRILATSGRPAVFDADTRTSAQSVDAALLAAGAAVQASDKVLEGTAIAFCAVRPPGHHAEQARAMGFCIFNNVAIAAAYAIARKALSKVLIVDPDVHHGNGTQHAFYYRRDVFYVSIHQYPFYPGTGALHENGEGEGKGYNVNFPLPGGMGDSEYVYVAETMLTEIVREYRPQLILFSAGFDAHALDPLGGMEVSTEGFLKFYSAILREAQKHRIPSVFVMEGGYSLEALDESVSLLLHALLHDELLQPMNLQSNDLIDPMLQQIRPSLPWK